jgi:hypothetical protein
MVSRDGNFDQKILELGDNDALPAGGFYAAFTNCLFLICVNLVILVVVDRIEFIVF